MAGEPDPVERLKMLIERAKITRARAAEVLGVDERTMRRWLTGESPCPNFAPDALEFRLSRKPRRKP